MRKPCVMVAFWLVTFVFVSIAHAQNPFFAQPKKEPAAPSPVMNSELLEQIQIWQHALREKMSQLVHQAKNTGNVKPLSFLLLAAFAYGAIHAAGPGHGKAIAFSYILSQRPTVLQAMLFSNALALFHGVSGILFILVVRVLLGLGMTKNLETVTYVTQLVSFGLITCLGLWIVVKGLVTLNTRRNGSGSGTPRPNRRGRYAGPVLSALMIGAVPCPGVVTVMLFALSMELIVLGVVLGIAISVGMALTVSVVVLMAMSGKAVSLLVASKDAKRLMLVESFIQTVAGLALTVLGLLFFLANL